MKTVVVLGTMDTKGQELRYLARQVEAAGCRALLMDVGVKGTHALDADISVAEVAATTGINADELRSMPRGEAVAAIGEAAAVTLERMVSAGQAHAVVSAGGSGGTTIATTAMRALPYGIPKLMVTTLASGNTRWHVDISDIVMMPSLLDISGLNPMLEMVLTNAAGAIAGMTQHYRPFEAAAKTVVSFTMYGTTTPGVTAARTTVSDAGYETWVFHASGVGGRTMESLMKTGRIHAVVDMTLAEIGAHLTGGLHDAGPHRLEAAASLGLPQVIVPGAADTVVLPPRDQVPDRFRNRTLNFHNPTMTTMRTEPDECVEIAEFIAAKLNEARGPVVVVLPTGGLSSIDKPGKIFHHPAANEALFSTLKQRLSSRVRVIEDEHHIDAPEFGAHVGELAIELIREHIQR